ncbi:hypothetical protein PENSPDRAFT_694389 [Peniophora sp. CONT]|nr:hypothetical protein PENSPDRAFT_694389 [Peniophora sp. CONT]
MSNTLASLTRLPDIFTYARTPKVQAFIADHMEESVLMVSMFQQLRPLKDPEFAWEHFQFVPDAHDVSILCRHDGEDTEATFYIPGILAQKSIMPYARFNDISQGMAWGQAAQQYVMLAMPGLQDMEDIKQAIGYIHVMGSLAYPEGQVRPLTDLIVDGEEVICASTPLGTPLHHTIPTDIPLVLTQQQDPNGVVTQYVQQRNMVILEDNQVDVYLATHLPKAGMYELHGGSCGPLRAEVGFRIVPAGKNRYMLRMDLKSVAIINDKIVATMAFAGVTAVSTQAKQTISLSSAGPSGLVVASKPRVKRANRKPKNLNKESQDAEATMIELPFQSE